MFWSKAKREKAGNQEAELHAAVLRRLREVIDYRTEAPDMMTMLSQAPGSNAIAANQGRQP